MTAVLDASAAVWLAIDPSQAPEIAKLAGEAELVLAPELLVAEVASAFWKYLRAGALGRDPCEIGLRSALGMVDEFAPLEPLSVEAFGLAAVMGRPVYDAFYLVLARRHGAVLASADRQLLRDAGVLGIRTCPAAG